MQRHVACVDFTHYLDSVNRSMEAADVSQVLAEKRPIMLKPNLVNDSPFPVTTAAKFCEAVVACVRQYTQSPIVIAEGCGDAQMETSEVFANLGYQGLSRRMGVALLDLNRAPLVRLVDNECNVFKEMWLPEVVFTHTLISLPVLKAHSLCGFTGTMKNMMGLAPPAHYAGRFGNWKKAAFHNHLDQTIADLNRYRSPDFTIMDATVGLADYHLGGARCDPPVNRILAASDPKALDREAAALLGIDWCAIGHLA